MTIKEIDSALEEGQSLKAIAAAYSEIANLKIKRIRNAVEKNRAFFREISGIYAIVKRFAATKKLNAHKPKKTVSIVLTSNYRFYGSINSKLLEFFAAACQKLDTDKICLGRAAVDYFRTIHLEGETKEVLLKDDRPDERELASLVNIIRDYSRVLVFYSSMKSLLIQQPVALDITASSETLPQNTEEFKFIFEPDLPKILQFFDSQVLTSLLEETFLESELARTASRFISMDTAENEANKFIREYQTLKAYAKRSLANNTILENFASMSAIRKEAYV